MSTPRISASAPATNPTRSLPLPRLPVEVWTMIIGHIPDEDCHNTWTNCRALSQILKFSTLMSAAESVFEKKFLPELVVLLRSPRSYLHSVYFQFVFDKLSDNSERVEMSVKKAFLRSRESEDEEEIKREFQDMTSSLPDINLPARAPPALKPMIVPNSVVALRGMSRDVALPDLMIDLEQVTLSFRWKEMLDTFFGEWNQMAMLLKNKFKPSTLTHFGWSGKGQLQPLQISKLYHFAEKATEPLEVKVRRMRFDKWRRRQSDDFPNLDEKWQQALEKAYEKGNLNLRILRMFLVQLKAIPDGRDHAEEKRRQWEMVELGRDHDPNYGYHKGGYDFYEARDLWYLTYP